MSKTQYVLILAVNVIVLALIFNHYYHLPTRPVEKIKTVEKEKKVNYCEFNEQQKSMVKAKEMCDKGVASIDFKEEYNEVVPVVKCK